MRDLARGAAVLILAALSCSKAPARPSTASPPSSTAASPGSAACGPAVEDQVDQVRIAVLEEMMARAARDAAAGGAPVGRLVVGEEQRLKPSGQIFVHDASPTVAEHFSARSPAAENYSTAFSQEQGKTIRKEDRTAFTTGEICWTSPARAIVPVRVLTGTTHRPGTATVERSGGGWAVTAVEMRR